MRFALCISGFMRNFHQSLPSLRASFLDRLACDIYVSTWDVVGHTHYKPSSPHHVRQTVEEPLTEGMLREVYGPWLKGYHIQPYDPESLLPDWLKADGSPLHRRTASMYFHIWKANQLKKQSGIDYTVTIRHRPDLFLINNLATMMENAGMGWQANPNKEPHVYIPYVECFHFLTNDQFMFGSTPWMDQVADIYPSIATPQKFWCVDPAEKTLDHYMAKLEIRHGLANIDYRRDS